MADTLLDSSALSAFCGSMANMLSAGIQVDEAVHMLADNQSDSRFKSVCADLYSHLIEGKPLSTAMEETGAFQLYAIEMVKAGEQSGRIEEVLRSLDTYFDEKSTAFAKLRAAVSYPAGLLCIMAVILAFTVAFILPVFVDSYERISGSLTTGSFNAVGISIVIGWIDLVVTIVMAAVVAAMTIASGSERGRDRTIAFFERLSFTREAMYELALARFTSALSTYVSSGLDTETSMARSKELVTNPILRKKLDAAFQDMCDAEAPLSLAQVISKHEIFEPVYARMIQVGSSTGSVDSVLNKLSKVFFEAALERVDQLIARVEPMLAAFLTIAVGATLISVMLPLIGIMRSIG